MKRVTRLLVFGLPIVMAAGVAWLFDDHRTARLMVRELWHGWKD